MEEHNTIRLGWRERDTTARPCGLSIADRRQHIYIIGKTGVGKSTLIRNLIAQDIAAGRGVGLIDPHGDLAREVLDFIPPSRFRETVYFNLADLDRPIGFNLLEAVSLDERHVVASGVVQAFKNIWADSWGPRLEYILYNAVSALLECGGSTLLGIPKLLTDHRYRSAVLRSVKDPMVARFWREEFEALPERLVPEVIAPIQNKVGRFLSSGVLRNILGQVTSSVDLRFALDNKRIVIANLSKGSAGADTANLIGSLLVTSFELAAMRRASEPEERRVDFALNIDEFHNFTTESLATVLSEARKYRLSLVLAHQYLDQLTDTARSAVFGNAGSLVVFRLGQADAEVLSRELEHEFSPDDLTTLGRGEVRLRLIQVGLPVTPFRAFTDRESGTRWGRGERLIRASRGRFGRPRHIVEEKIARFLRSGADWGDAWAAR